MSEHPISGLVSTALQSIKEMIDVNTIVGEPVETPDGSVIIPISRVSFGFGAGGSEFGQSGASAKDEGPGGNFGGGSAAGVSISPVAFLVVGGGQVKLLPINANGSAVDKLVDYIPYAFDKVNAFISKKRKGKDAEEE